MALPPEYPERTVVLQDPALRRLKGFTQVPNAVLRHPILSHGAKLTFGVLLSYAWQEDFCRPAQETLASDMGCSIRQVRRFLVELRTFHFVDWKQQGLNRPNRYYILPQTRWVFGTAISADGTDVADPDRTDLSRPDRTPAADQDGTPMSDKEDSKKNTHNVDNVDQSDSRKEADRERQLTRNEYVEAKGLTLHIQDTIGQPENHASYFVRAAEAVRRGNRGVQALMEVLSATKDAKLRGRLRKTASQYFHGAWERVLPTLGPQLPSPPRSKETASQHDDTDRATAKLAVQEFLARPRIRVSLDEQERLRRRNED